MIFEYIFTYILRFCTILDTHSLSKFVDLMATVVPVASVIAILESKAILGSFGEKKD